MLSEFEQKVGDFIKANELFSSADKVLLAVSGGADSTALLYAMHALSSENVFGAELLCAHINHQLRGAEADSDEDFVIAQAASLKLAVTTKHVDVRGFAGRNKLSIETAARKLRIKNLLEIAGANNCDCVATAHQKNDNAETILQRLTRGTGFRGLGGIWPMRVFADEFKFVRPLLCVRRDEIIKYLEQRNLKWRQDHTNTDCTYRRNYIRHRLLPALQQDCSGSLVEQLSELSESACRFYKLVCSRADEIWPEPADCVSERMSLDLKVLLAQPQPVMVELIRRSLTALGCGERDLTQRHYEGILRLAEQNISGKEIELPGEFVVGAEYGNLIFSGPEKRPHSEEQIVESIRLEVPGQTRFGRNLVKAVIFKADEKEFEKFKAEKTNFIERFDFDKIKPPLVVRFRKAGDRFVPLGLGEEKKVGKFLTAARVPQEVRQKLLIINDSEKIIWVWPIRTSEQAKVTSGTRKILQLQIIRMPMHAK
ncbi:MAG TPA: tRNA lysidine(34) synthetase TilS [Sedimentisphaerales bacterium]|nr:tRNA lysidine(34) synthetase TilS [Sedimentisphaerales bacterium]